MYRQTEFVGDSNKNTASRRAVELCHYQAGDSRSFPEYFHLTKCILTDGRVEHEKHGVRRSRLDLAHDAHHLFQFAHQFGAVLQTSRRIDEHDLDALFFGCGDCIEGEPGSVSARLASHHMRTCAFSPDLQLIDRGGPKSVTRNEHHAFSLRAESRRKLANGRGLTGTVDAGHQYHERSRGDLERPRNWHKRFLDLGSQEALHFVRREALGIATLAQRVDDPHGHILSEIGPHELVLK